MSSLSIRILVHQGGKVRPAAETVQEHWPILVRNRLRHRHRPLAPPGPRRRALSDQPRCPRRTPHAIIGAWPVRRPGRRTAEHARRGSRQGRGPATRGRRRRDRQHGGPRRSSSGPGGPPDPGADLAGGSLGGRLLPPRSLEGDGERTGGPVPQGLGGEPIDMARRPSHGARATGHGRLAGVLRGPGATRLLHWPRFRHRPRIPPGPRKRPPCPDGIRRTSGCRPS